MRFLFCLPLLLLSIVFTVNSWYDEAGFNNQEIVYGLTYEDSEFYQEFWGPLVPLSEEDYTQLSADQQKEILRQSLETEYQTKRSLIATRYPELTEEQQWLAFLTLRVNGSIPIYAQQSPAKNLTELVYKNSASCNGYSLRLSFVLRAFGYDPKIFGFATPSIPGHVIVTLTDVQGDAILLDANTNAIIVYPNSTKDFFETIADSTVAANAEQLQIYLFPYYERAFLPLGIQRLSETKPVQDERNAVYTAAIQAGWLSALTEEQTILNDSLVSHTDVDMAHERAIIDYEKFWNL